MTGFYPASLAARPTDYIIGPADTLNIRVIGEPELTATYTVRLDGRIMFPYLGENPGRGNRHQRVQPPPPRRLTSIY